MDNITTAIASQVKKEKISRGKVITIDPTGEMLPVYLTKNIDGFGEFDFDEVTAEIELDLLEEFSVCPVIENLLAAARANPALFSEPDEG